ncbi:MAG TPA: hypothetical protein VGN72_21895 [Tepidisphaeraceae bacterium]|nr:hypothetical protein [Tepidisphaeraceae bacterium]
MGIREKLNENPAITTGATIGIIVIALIFIGYQLFSSDSAAIQTTGYYTTDDSSPEAALAAMFSDDINKLPPFDKDGKPAYRAFVYSCDGGSTKWIAYLQRYTKEAQAKLEAARAKPEGEQGEPGMIEMLHMTGVEVKRPGTGTWVNQSNFEKSRDVTDIKCPDGTLDNIEAVMP